MTPRKGWMENHPLASNQPKPGAWTPEQIVDWEATESLPLEPTTAEGWADHAAELRADDARLRDVDYDRAADDYFGRRMG